MESEKGDDFLISIVRSSINVSSITGELFANKQFLCHTLELPWENNASYISSIPSGTYSAHLRYDKADKWRIQLDDVPGRTAIQIHMGNYPSDIEGCVLIGDEVINSEDKLREGTSASANTRLKEMFYGSSNPHSTPDVNLKVEVRYNVGQTEYENDERKIIRVGQAKWETYHKYAGKQDDKSEVKRDLNFIYFHSKSNGFSRIILHGGKVELSSNINGPWKLGYGIFRRKN